MMALLLFLRLALDFLVVCYLEHLCFVAVVDVVPTDEGDCCSFGDGDEVPACGEPYKAFNQSLISPNVTKEIIIVRDVCTGNAKERRLPQESSRRFTRRLDRRERLVHLSLRINDVLIYQDEFLLVHSPLYPEKSL